MNPRNLLPTPYKSVRVSTGTHRKLKEICEKHNMQMIELVNRIADYYFEQHEDVLKQLEEVSLKAREEKLLKNKLFLGFTEE